MARTPHEFLLEIQNDLVTPQVGIFASQEYQAITVKQYEEAGIQIPADPLTAIIDGCVDRALQGLQAEQRENVKRHVAFGVAQTGDINATIYASGDGVYAVLINRGLMMFLNKFLKITITQGRPEKIIYVDDDAKSLFETGGVYAVLNLVRENYLKYGDPLGGKIKPIPQIAGKIGALLVSGETFAVCHEIGHYLNGDLDNALVSAKISNDGEGIQIHLPIEHRMEFKADTTGYGIYSRGMVASGWENDPKALMAGVSTLFDAFGYLDYGESPTHPHPLKRVINAAYFGHGAEEAEFWLQSYKGLMAESDFTELENFKKSLGKQI